MEFIYKELTEEEIFKFTIKQTQEKIKEIREIYENLEKVLITLIKKRLEFVLNYDIKTITINPVFKYEDFTEEMVDITKAFFTIDGSKTVPKYFKDAEEINFNDLKKKIYNEIVPLAPLMFFFDKSLIFNISELRTKRTRYTLKANSLEKNQIKSLHDDSDIKHIFKNTTENKILKFTPKQVQEKIEEIKKIYESLSKMSVILVKKKITEIATDYDLSTIYVNFYLSRYNHDYDIYFDNKYMHYPQNKIIPKYYENIKDISFNNLYNNIRDRLKPLSLLINKKINFDLSELRTEFMYEKLKENIQIKNLDSKSKLSRHKI